MSSYKFTPKALGLCIDKEPVLFYLRSDSRYITKIHILFRYSILQRHDGRNEKRLANLDEQHATRSGADEDGKWWEIRNLDTFGGFFSNYSRFVHKLNCLIFYIAELCSNFGCTVHVLVCFIRTINPFSFLLQSGAS